MNNKDLEKSIKEWQELRKTVQEYLAMMEKVLKND